MHEQHANERKAPQFEAEVACITDVYAHRDAMGIRFLYSWTRPEVYLQSYFLAIAVSRLLKSWGWIDLSDRECLDVGWGNGAWLRKLMDWGTSPSGVHGIGILRDVSEQAKSMAPQIDCGIASGWSHLCANAPMDLVSAHAVFSSILDPSARAALAGEMMRVTRPGGLVLVFDFRVSSPRNRDTVGIPAREIRRLFPGLRVRKQSLVLAPPVQRVIGRVSIFVAHAMEVLLPVLRTHACYAVEKSDNVD